MVKSSGAVLAKGGQEALASVLDTAVSTPKPASAPTALVTGIVYKDEDGDDIYDARADIPIPGAIVSAWLDGEVVAIDYADKEGRYLLSVPFGTGYTLKVSLPSTGECYDPRFKRWGVCSTIKGQKDDVKCPADNQDISIGYRMLNYGPKGFSWELWHKGPILEKRDVVLVHGFRLPGAAKRGRCDEQFARLDDLLQTEDDQYNVWQFEYASSSQGTPDSVATYASRLGEAVNKISKLTGNDKCSIVAYSMGGIIARQYIADGGKARVDKLFTLATPNMGTLRFEPFDLKWSDRFIPRAAAELRPDSRTLWDLNTDVASSTVPDFAAIGGYSWGHTDGVIEMGSTSLVESNPDGSVAKKFYFAGVKRSHLNINRIKNKQDEVFQLIRSFLRGGATGIEGLRQDEEPKEHNARFFLIFALKENPRWRIAYPSVVISKSGRRYRGFKVFSQGARTEDRAYIFAVQMQPDDDGEARIYYSRGRYATVQVHRGQTTIVTKPIGTI